mgnify:CR=1 FL=1
MKTVQNELLQVIGQHLISQSILSYDDIYEQIEHNSNLQDLNETDVDIIIKKVEELLEYIKHV